MKANKNKNADIVVVAFCDPADKSQTSASALELTKKQAEAVVDHLKAWQRPQARHLLAAQAHAAGDGDEPIADRRESPRCRRR